MQPTPTSPTNTLGSTWRVGEINPLSDPRWEAFVASRPDATVHHHPLWLQLLREVFNCIPAHLACEDADGRLRGVLPLFAGRGPLTGRHYSSLPRTPSGGPLAVDVEATTALLEAAVERVRQERGASLQLKVAAPIDRPVAGLMGGEFRPTYILTLPPRDQPLRIGDAGYHRGVKSNVRKAARLGVEVREAEQKRELRRWYDLYLETMRFRFVPPRPYRFFDLAWDLLRPSGLLRVLLVEQRRPGATKLLGGGVFMLFGETVTYAFAGSSRADLELRPNDALQWHAISNAHQAGNRFYDMGEVGRGNAGLAVYKQKWGAERRWLYRYYFPALRERELAVLESEGRAVRLARAAWQHVPLPMTQLISVWLHRYL
jgi:hypothetical protein